MRRACGAAIAVAVVSSVALAVVSSVVLAVPFTPQELTALCAQADGPAHCGRLVEEVQLKRLPNLATRDGANLKVQLYPAGVATFTDSESLHGGRSYSLWDYIDAINSVVIYTLQDDNASFTLLHRPTGRKVEMPGEPRLSPNRQWLVTADFCPTNCVNELALWRVTREGVRKAYAWRPGAAWDDAVPSWKDADTVIVEYTPAGKSEARRLERRVDAADWKPAESP